MTMSDWKRPSDDELLDAWEADAAKCCRSCEISAAHLRSGNPDYVAGFLRHIATITRERDEAREYAERLRNLLLGGEDEG